MIIILTGQQGLINTPLLVVVENVLFFEQVPKGGTILHFPGSSKSVHETLTEIQARINHAQESLP